MFKITLQSKDKRNYTDVIEYDISYPFNTFSETENFFYTLENVEHKNIKGNYSIYYCKKINLNHAKFDNSFGEVKIDGGSLYNANAAINWNQRHRLSFNPTLQILNKKEIQDEKIFRKNKDVLKVQQFLLFQKLFLISINVNLNTLKPESKFQNLKNEFPSNLVRI